MEYKSKRKKSLKWVLWGCLIAMALIIIIFNDAFGDSEVFVFISFLYFLLLIFLLLRWIFKQVTSILRLKKEKAQMEMQHLKSQVNPHFFFNTLNNLYGLVGKNPKKAQQLILKLSDLMRYGIYESERDFVTLEEEIVYIQNYLELHKMRYHKKIDLQFEKDVKIAGFRVIPLLFILLLENAFKHGVESLRDNAFVHIKLRADEGELHFSISNNFDPDEVSGPAGIGLKNLIRRLELAYHNKHSLSLTKNQGVYNASLSLKQI